jgi:hypothetical protein
MEECGNANAKWAGRDVTSELELAGAGIRDPVHGDR